MKKKVLQLEFNEICPDLVDRFISQGHLPNFQRLKHQSCVFTSDAEEKAPYLEPWIQWVTVHTGLSFAEHKIFDLGDGHKLKAPRIWDIIGQHGHKVWICGSMNASFERPIDGYILPDPWSAAVKPYPDGMFDSFFNFVQANVQEHTRRKTPVSRSEQLAFLGFMVKHGMRPETVTSLIKQLMDERGGLNHWKRATILDRLQWDVFSWLWRREQPAFSTFFVNSTAHYQHHYWRNMDPSLFSAKPSEADQKDHEEAVLFGYKQMDAIIEKCLRLADRETIVMLVSALSQQPCLKYESFGGKEIYRPEDFRKLFEFAGVPGQPEIAPVMAEQFKLLYQSEAEARAAEKAFLELRMEDKKVISARSEGNEVFAGCSVFRHVASDAVVTNGRGASRSFYSLFYNCHLTTSGMHHPDGVLWISMPDRGSRVQTEKVSLRIIAPTILSLLDCPVPDFMLAPLEVVHEANLVSAG
jgi:hypothetical protein